MRSIKNFVGAGLAPARRKAGGREGRPYERGGAEWI
jgi:hypothetical protein